MLRQLHIKNFALIEELEIELEKGLNVLTGETGAGKSIVIDAVNFILGERSAAGLIRTGADKCRIEASFELEDTETLEFIKSRDVDPEDDTIVFSRELSRSGKSSCKINGSIAALSRLKEIGENLIDIHGQHEHQFLLKVSHHLDLLDRWGGEKLWTLREGMKELYKNFQGKKSELDEILKGEQDRSRELDWLRFEINEIEKAKPEEGEEEALTKEKALLANAEKIKQHLNTAYLALSSGEPSALDLVTESSRALAQASLWDEEASSMAEKLKSIELELKEVSGTLSAHLDKVEFDPVRLEEVNERLHQISQLKKKYGSSFHEIMEHLKKCRQRFERLNNSELSLGKIKKEIEVLEKEITELSERLSIERRRAAVSLEKKITRELEELGMSPVEFKAEIKPKDEIGSTGSDDVKFLISPNPGEPLKPLSKIASGGEISRIMLAVKTILGRLDGIPTLIFDEIDTGLGGRAAESVAKKLYGISRERQVLCVTHLPVIASKADSHYYLYKESDAKKTCTFARKIKGDERVRELARMLSGASITPTTIKHAKEMIGRT